MKNAIISGVCVGVLTFLWMFTTKVTQEPSPQTQQPYKVESTILHDQGNFVTLCIEGVAYYTMNHRMAPVYLLDNSGIPQVSSCKRYNYKVLNK